jgi:chitin synthase
MITALEYIVSLLQQAWVWLLWLLSQTWITLHIWTPKAERLATTERLFVLPMYDSLLIDQSLGLNRRCDDEADVKTEVPSLESNTGLGPYRLLRATPVCAYSSRWYNSCLMI